MDNFNDDNLYCNKHLKNLIIECFNSNVISYDLNLITLDEVSLFLTQDDFAINNKNLQNIYSNFLEDIFNTYFIDVCICPDNLLSLNLNSIFSFKYNRDVFFFNYNTKLKYKKGIINLNKLLKKYKEDRENLDINESIPVNILIPIFFNNNKEYQEYLKNFIKILKTFLPINKIIIINIFDLFDLTKLNINGVHEISFITKNYIFEVLFNEGIITNDKYNTIKMFLENDKSIHEIVNKNIFNYVNSSFFKIINKKKSKICVDIESIKDIPEIIKFTNMIGEYISSIRINSNNIFNEKILIGLRKLADYHNFLIIDDNKLFIQNNESLANYKLFKYVDLVTVNLNSIIPDLNIQVKTIRENINKNASIIILKTANLSINNIQKINEYYKEICFGIINISKSIENVTSIINYSELSKLHDNFLELRKTDLTILGKELINQKNPILILQKINNIMFHVDQ